VSENIAFTAVNASGPLTVRRAGGTVSENIAFTAVNAS